MNNIGTTTKTLTKTIGNDTAFTTGDTVTVTTGAFNTGLLVFDQSGTLGVVSSITDSENFSVTTSAISIDVPTVLNNYY